MNMHDFSVKTCLPDSVTDNIYHDTIRYCDKYNAFILSSADHGICHANKYVTVNNHICFSNQQC